MTKQVHVVNKADLSLDRALYVEREETSFLLYQVDQHHQAIAAVCTHQKIPLTDECIFDNTVFCPLHGARFDLHTGRCLRGPAIHDLRIYRVTETEEVLYVELD
jgi:nitrite reductase/ring-hydroxylating ferredoxin subunit